MQQAVNLFDHLDKREALAVSAMHIGIAATATFLLMLLMSAVMFYNSSQSAGELQKAERKEQQLEEQLTQLRATGTADSRAVDRLKRLIKERRQILLSLSNRREDIGDGFSEHMAGLGRQQLTGLWLNHIELRAGGTQISLRGEMRKASLLPRYLQDLGKEPVFSGLRFQLMRIEDIETSEDEMRFEITVVPDQVSEGDDA